MVEDQAQRERVVGVDQQGQLFIAAEFVERRVGQGRDVRIEFGRVAAQSLIVHPAVCIDMRLHHLVEGGVIEGRTAGLGFVRFLECHPRGAK